MQEAFNLASDEEDIKDVGDEEDNILLYYIILLKLLMRKILKMLLMMKIIYGKSQVRQRLVTR